MCDNIVGCIGDVALNCCQIMLQTSVHSIMIKNAKAANKMGRQCKTCIRNYLLHSLYSRGDEGHTDHHQVQNIEIVSTE